ncbi:MAG: ABC transporter permease subunit [Alphaproteobacteria bacterium]|jgi:NitT/TauT family transport system permease protein|nr:ABC transporter permease subunit [Alphaproteobacteria bacterium]
MSAARPAERVSVPGLIAVPILAAIALAAPAGISAEGASDYLVRDGADALLAVMALGALAVGLALPHRLGRTLEALAVGGSGVLLGLLLLDRLRDGLMFRVEGIATWAVLLLIAAALWRAMDRLSALPARWTFVVLPLLFGGLLVYLWEALTVGFRVPAILLPPPSVILDTVIADAATLWVDFEQTFIRSAVPGFLIGCSAGFLTAVAIDRSPFLQRGLLPLGSLVSAMPIVGIAPIMVMWFGFDWQSKAAVVVVMTFFPMLVNATAGLQATGAMERELMRSYAASYWQTLIKLRLPGALPFIFNALKLNATLALIGAIVAEFFGTPIYGMGFRISTEVARLNVDKVWATIAVAAMAGTASYGLLVLLERRTTFWHPSQRKSDR